MEGWINKEEEIKGMVERDEGRRKWNGNVEC